MKRALVFLAIALGARTGAGGSNALSQVVENTLTTIDEVPTQAQLDTAFDNQAMAGLVTIAQDSTDDVGIRLRAIRALVDYCSPCTSGPAHDTVLAILNDNASALSGSDVLVLRAAAETAGAMQLGDALAPLVSLLDHSSRDVRATAALALGDLGNGCAIMPLRTRYQHEPTQQVQLAISQALRELGQAPCN